MSPPIRDVTKFAVGGASAGYAAITAMTINVPLTMGGIAVATVTGVLTAVAVTGGLIWAFRGGAR